MKKLLLLFLFFYAATVLSAQDTNHISSPDSCRALVIRHYAGGNPNALRKPFYIYPGQRMQIKVDGGEMLEGVLTAVGDSTFTIDSTTIVPISIVRTICWFQKKNGPLITAIIGGTLMTAGVALIAWSVSDQPDLIEALGALLGGLVVGTAGLITGVTGLLLLGREHYRTKELDVHLRLGTEKVSGRKNGKPQRR